MQYRTLRPVGRQRYLTTRDDGSDILQVCTSVQVEPIKPVLISHQNKCLRFNNIKIACNGDLQRVNNIYVAKLEKID